MQSYEPITCKLQELRVTRLLKKKKRAKKKKKIRTRALSPVPPRPHPRSLQALEQKKHNKSAGDALGYTINLPGML